MGKLTDIEKERRAVELYVSALDLEPQKRPSFLEKNCSDDSALRDRVGELLVWRLPIGLLPLPWTATLPRSYWEKWTALSLEV